MVEMHFRLEWNIYSILMVINCKHYDNLTIFESYMHFTNGNISNDKIQIQLIRLSK